LSQHRSRLERTSGRACLSQHAWHQIHRNDRDALIGKGSVPLARAAAHIKQAHALLKLQSREDSIHEPFGALAIAAMGFDADSKPLGVAVLICDEVTPS